jgi:hypothetical protein
MACHFERGKFGLDAGLVSNLFVDLPVRTDAEVFTEILAREGVRIERIVSTGQFTSMSPIARITTNGSCSSLVRPACGSRAKVSALCVRATMSSLPLAGPIA